MNRPQPDTRRSDGLKVTQGVPGQGGEFGAAEEAVRGAYPRISLRVNSTGYFDAYLIKSAWSKEIWVSTGPTITGALWWCKR